MSPPCVAPPRLRHLCLVAPRLEPAVQALQKAFGLEVAYRDPLVAMWGIENAVLPLGNCFLEICAPVVHDRAAARFIAKRPEGGGYIVVMECCDLDRRRARLAGLGVRLVTDLGIPGFHTLQMPPQDTGACMLEFNHTESGGAPLGPYTPAGPHWQRAIRRECVDGLAAITVRARAPERLASHWGHITEAPVSRGPYGGPQLVLGPAIQFTVAGDDEAEGVAVVELSVRDPEAVLARALASGARPSSAQSLRLLGLEFRLVAPA